MKLFFALCALAAVGSVYSAEAKADTVSPGVCIIGSYCKGAWGDGAAAAYTLRINEQNITGSYVSLNGHEVTCPNSSHGSSYGSFDPNRGADDAALSLNEAKATHDRILAQAEKLKAANACVAIVDNSEFAQ